MKKLYLIIFIGLVLRLSLTFYFGNLQKADYWEYGEIAKNIINGNGYSLFYFKDAELNYHYNKNIKPAQSAYMPPGYVYFLVPFLLIKNIFIRNFLIVFIQILMSVFIIRQIFVLSKYLFSDKIALIAAFLVAITPEFIYADYSFTPTIIFQLLVILLFKWFLTEGNDTKSIILIGLIITVICYFRAEFVLFAVMLICYKFFRKEYKFSLILLFMLILLLSPWSLRNYYSFGKFIPLTTSFGTNLYRGNNNTGIGEWGSHKIVDEIRDNTERNPEVAMNSIYTNHAIDFIKSNPVKTLENAGIKIFYLMLFNRNDIRSRNIFYEISTFFYLIFFIYGIIITFSIKKFRYYYIFFIYFLLIVIIFFPMIRYQAMMRIMMVPFCAVGVAYFYCILKNMMKKAGQTN